MRIAVCITTLNRHDLTRITVESFLAHNHRDDFDLFYGDDNSSDDCIHDLMERHNVPCLVKAEKQLGCSVLTDRLVAEVLKASDTPAVLVLQNDMESIRPIPLDVVDQVFKDADVGWIRLQGVWENAITHNRPLGTNNAAVLKRHHAPEVVWRRCDMLGETLERGDIHWAFASITRRELIGQMTRGAKCATDIIRQAAPLKKLTVRFCENVVNHIGTERTPGGIFYSR